MVVLVSSIIESIEKSGSLISIVPSSRVLKGWVLEMITRVKGGVCLAFLRAIIAVLFRSVRASFVEHHHDTAILICSGWLSVT